MIRIDNDETITIRVLDSTGTPVTGLDSSEFRITILHAGGALALSPYSIQEVDDFLAPGFYAFDVPEGTIPSEGPVDFLVRPRSQWQPTEAASEVLEDVDLRDGTNGWAVGRNGTILSTSDSGDSWSVATSPTSETLLAVSDVSTSEAWAAGEAATILVWDGTSWSEEDTGSVTWESAYSDVSGRVVSGADDGTIVEWDGTSITELDDGTTSGGETIRDLAEIDSGAGRWIAVADGGVIMESDDDAQTWSTVSSGTNEDLLAVSFPTTSDGWIVGTSGTMLTSSDGGNNWSAQTIDSTGDLRAVDFFDASNGWAAGDDGEMFETTDGGSTWSRIDGGQTETLRAVESTSVSDAVFVGGDNRGVSVYGTTSSPSFEDVIFEEIATVDFVAMVERTLGLSHENYRITDQTYDAEGRMIGAKVSTYPSDQDTIDMTNPVAEYEITAFWDTEGRLEDWRMIEV